MSPLTIIFIGCITLFASIIVSVAFYKKLRPRWLRYFPWYLIYTLLFEFAAWAYSHYTKKSNHFLININELIEFLFYLFIFYKAFERKYLKRFTIYLTAVLLLFSCYNFIFGAGIWIFSSLNESVGTIFIIVCCLVYFYSLFGSEMDLNYFRIPMFWISTGLLFYHVGTFIYICLLNYIVRNNLDPHGMYFRTIFITLNLLLYGLFTYGFLSNQIWKKEK